MLLNHPDRLDSLALIQLSRKMHEDFYCIVARECFDWYGGLLGWFFQNIGCYSVTRGKTDFHSIAMTKKILQEGRRKLLVFPEGEITADYFKLHKIHDAIFHIALTVQKDLFEANSESPVLIFPAATKFHLECDLASAVNPCLNKIEKRLQLNKNIHPDTYFRINSVVQAYLQLVLDSYGMEKPQTGMENLAEFVAVEILRKIALRTGVACDESLSPLERLYAFRNKAAGHAEERSVALKSSKLRCLGISKPCIYSDFERIERLLILQKMLDHPFCDMEYCRILDFIECELFETISPKGWQSCAVLIGAPVDASSFLLPFLESKEKGVKQLSEHFKEKLQSLLLTNLALPDKKNSRAGLLNQ